MGASPNRYGTRSRGGIPVCRCTRSHRPVRSLTSRSRGQSSMLGALLLVLCTGLRLGSSHHLLFQPTFPTEFNICVCKKYSTFPLLSRLYFPFIIIHTTDLLYHLHASGTLRRQFKELRRMLVESGQRGPCHRPLLSPSREWRRALVLDSCAVSCNSAVLARGC